MLTCPTYESSGARDPVVWCRRVGTVDGGVDLSGGGGGGRAESSRVLLEGSCFLRFVLKVAE